MEIYNVEYWDKVNECWKFEMVNSWKLDAILKNPNYERVRFERWENTFPY